MTIFRTENSTYEVDEENKRVKRMYGRRSPTDRQGPDGEWRSYEEITEIAVGRPVYILWGTDAKLPVLIGKMTVTSPVTEVGGSDAN